VREVRTGVWHWQAPHPEWEPGADGLDWPETKVSSYAIDDGARLLLFDPLDVPEEIEELAGDRETAIVLTCPWHRRDAPALSERLGWPIHVPPPDARDPDPVKGEVFVARDRLPGGVEASLGMEPNDLVLWVESHRALVAGDTLIDRGEGLVFPLEWADRGTGEAPDQMLERLRAVLEHPVELMLPTHGPPTDRAALERALDA
jgi:glyoxylase-like metal-dependent hydrolase (beta-lactamase superfamily II)